jgi:ubiquinone biosynthesis protein Coq4
VRPLIGEGAQIAQQAIWMAEIEWEERLGEPIDELRAELGFQPPSRYKRLRQQAPQLLFAA